MRPSKEESRFEISDYETPKIIKKNTHTKERKRNSGTEKRRKTGRLRWGVGKSLKEGDTVRYREEGKRLDDKTWNNHG